MPYFSAETITRAISDLRGTANHLVKIWFVLKQMGMTDDKSVVIDTSSSKEALERLFHFGDPSGDFFIPFAHTKRFMTMKGDADRSIIQTTINRWAVSGSVVTVDPTDYIDITLQPDNSLLVSQGKNYPLGLGYGKNGFALHENSKLEIPLTPFAIWYYRQTAIEDVTSLLEPLQARLRLDLSISLVEQELVFSSEQPAWNVSLQDRPVTDEQLNNIVTSSMSLSIPERVEVHYDYRDYTTKITSMTTISDGPRWLEYVPENRLNELFKDGSKAILLFGPPRTGKTRAVDKLLKRDDPNRRTIQIHSGWGYDELVISLRPKSSGEWEYVEGPLLQAIKSKATVIVLEEINRTEFSQAIGEILSLLEATYRGEENKITLRNGEEFFIPKETVFICTMNTVDRSTEELDDALIGRFDAVEFKPRVESLSEMLSAASFDESKAEKTRILFAYIQQYYPLGHGYFADYKPDRDLTKYYLSKIRPVLQKHFKGYRDDELSLIDKKVEELRV